MASERRYGCEASERGKRVQIIVKETGDRPCAATVGMLAGPGVTFAAEAARTDDVELFHVQAT